MINLHIYFNNKFITFEAILYVQTSDAPWITGFYQKICDCLQSRIQV